MKTCEGIDRNFCKEQFVRDFNVFSRTKLITVECPFPDKNIFFFKKNEPCKNEFSKFSCILIANKVGRRRA